MIDMWFYLYVLLRCFINSEGVLFVFIDEIWVYEVLIVFYYDVNFLFFDVRFVVSFVFFSNRNFF